MTEYNQDCLYFTGYKPCKFKRACQGCPTYAPVAEHVLIVSLEALGAVLRSTCLLEPIRRQHPEAMITWLTLPSAKALLENNPQIDRILTLDVTTRGVLEHLEFDALYCVDKSMAAGALAETINAKLKRGFGLTRTGVIRPLSEHADFQFEVGLNDQLKFFDNEKPETQQITETMGLEWQRDPYLLELTQEESKEATKRRRKLRGESLGVIGFNTGCSALFPYKKFTIPRSVEVIGELRKNFPQYTVALFGGREDQTRQEEMKAAFVDDNLVVNTPTTEGLRSGILWMEAADYVISGDTLGLHIAIALKKPSVAWFGLSCPQEIDLFERGVKVNAEVKCSPCWKRSCDKEPKCYDEVSPIRIAEAVRELMERFPAKVLN